MSQLVDRHIQREQERSLEPWMKLPQPDPALRQPLIEPYRGSQLQPASYDLRLGREIRTEHDLTYDISKHPNQDGDGWYMHPGAFLLGHTEEYFRIPAHLCARVEGKSSTGRRGLAVHVTAGFIDPGFNGQITLELVNHSQLNAFKLVPGMLIAQITFHRLTDQPERLYGSPDLGSHYQGQTGATPAARLAWE